MTPELNHIFCQACEKSIQNSENRPICKGCFQNLKKLQARPVIVNVGPLEAMVAGLACYFANFLQSQLEIFAINAQHELNKSKENLKDKDKNNG